MAATDVSLLKTKVTLNGKEIEVPIPQVFNSKANAYEPLAGENGAPYTGLEDLLQLLNIDFATNDEIQSIASKLSNDPATQAGLTAILNKLSSDPATQTTLAAVLTAINALGQKDFATQTTLAAVLNKLSADPATQTTLVAILNKLSSDPATQTTLAAVKTVIDAILSIHQMDKRGLSTNKPAANTVTSGTTYWSVDTGTIEVSDGSTWRAV